MKIKQTEIQYKDRKRTRLKGHDYSETGMYYVTICTYNRINMFGEIHDIEMILNDAGYMVESVLKTLQNYYPGILMDTYIVMPNHIHAIIGINYPVGAGPCAGPDNSSNDNKTLSSGQARGPVPTAKLSLSDIVYRIKSLTTNKYIDGVKNNNWKSFDKHLWQRSFHDHIIRTNESLDKIREYIINNPKTWDDDTENINKDLQQCASADGVNAAAELKRYLNRQSIQHILLRKRNHLKYRHL